MNITETNKIFHLFICINIIFIKCYEYIYTIDYHYYHMNELVVKVKVGINDELLGVKYINRVAYY